MKAITTYQSLEPLELKGPADHICPIISAVGGVIANFLEAVDIWMFVVMVIKARLLVLIYFVRIFVQNVIHVLIEYFKLVHKAFIPTPKGLNSGHQIISKSFNTFSTNMYGNPFIH